MLLIEKGKKKKFKIKMSEEIKKFNGSTGSAFLCIRNQGSLSAADDPGVAGRRRLNWGGHLD